MTPPSSLILSRVKKKSAKGVQEGLSVIGIGGLWDWIKKGTSRGIEDFDKIAWEGRVTTIIPDSDVWVSSRTKQTELQRPVYALGKEMERRGAKVDALVLPQDGKDKIGLDDYLLRHSRDDLSSLPRLTLKDKPLSEHESWWKNWQKSKEGTAIKDSPYRIESGRIVKVKHTPNGPITSPLCNFVAGVTEEIILDDGAETSRSFIIEGKLDNGQPLPPVPVAGNRFNNMNWVTDCWGLHAVINAGQANRDCLREAIQILSSNARSRRVYTHMGWRKIKDRWVYLSATGAVGEAGFEVNLGPDLARYQLPRKPEDPVGAMRTSLELLNIAPLSVTVPLWGGCLSSCCGKHIPR